MNVLALIGILGPALPVLVKAVESLFPSKTGSTKADVVAATVKQVTDALAAGGILPGLPDGKVIREAIDATVARLNASGQLQGPATQLTVDANVVQSAARQILAGAVQLLDAAKL